MLVGLVFILRIKPGRISSFVSVYVHSLCMMSYFNILSRKSFFRLTFYVIQFPCVCLSPYLLNVSCSQYPVSSFILFHTGKNIFVVMKLPKRLLSL